MGNERIHLPDALGQRYRLDRQLGWGGMATVYLAEDRKYGRNVAVKVLHADVAAALGPERFLREIEIAARLNHPHILAVYDSGEAHGLLYYVTPYVEGQSLRERLEREARLPVDEAIAVAREIADGLSYAHELGVVHRDIKPENILLSAGHAVIADFGLATGDADLADPQTRPGIAVGTPTYMSPEQLTGDPVDFRSDIYALGCVLYEMLAGQPPHEGATVKALIWRKLAEPVLPIGGVRPTAPDAIQDVLATALARAPEDRFASAREFALALTRPAGVSFGPIKSIVVLPFASLSTDPENDYFTDGLTAEVIGHLSKVRALRVISRTSSMALKGAAGDLRTIARQLGVAYVLEGSVRRAGSRLRITAQLIDASADQHLWTEHYDGVIEDVLAMQERLARAIVDALKLRLSAEEERRLAERPMSNLHAYECYLRARHEAWRWRKDSIDHAVQLLQNGLALAADSARLHATLGLAHLQYREAGIDLSDGPLERAEACARKVFSLDPQSAQGFQLRGSIEYARGRVQEAVRDLKSALVIDPNNPDTLLLLSNCYLISGKPAAARPLVGHLLSVDPLTPLNRCMPGWIELLEGNFAAAVEPYRRMFEMDPTNPMARLFYAWVLAFNHDHDQAIAIANGFPTEALETLPARTASFLAHALAGHPRQDALAALTPEVEAVAARTDVFPRILAHGFALLDDVDRALYWLTITVQRGFVNYPFIATHDPFFDGLRGDPRFGELLETVRERSDRFET